MNNTFNQFKTTVNFLIEQDNLLWEKVKDKVHYLYISFSFLISILFINYNFIKLNILFGFLLHLVLFLNIYFFLFYIYKFYNAFNTIKENFFLSTLNIFFFSVLNYFYMIYNIVDGDFTNNIVLFDNIYLFINNNILNNLFIYLA